MNLDFFHRFLPDKTFVAANEKTAPGRKILKERITFLLCANADGSHKLKPLVIGKSANPRCFKGFKNPLDYVNSKKSWMNSEIFFNWFHNSFIKQVRQFSAENNLPPKALLLIDNCTAHKPIDMLRSHDGNIAAMLLPPNVTAVLQPMDQNPIRLVKLGYRSKLLCNIAAQENIPIEKILRTHTIRDAILLLNSVWDELPQSVLIKAWNKIKKWDDDQYDSEDDVPLSELTESNSAYNDTLREVQLLMSKVGDNVDISIDEIENWNNDKILEDNGDSEVSDNDNDGSIIEQVTQQSKVSYSKAVESINTLIKLFENNNDAQQVADLVNIRTKMIKNYYTKEKKQTSIIASLNHFIQINIFCARK